MSLNFLPVNAENFLVYQSWFTRQELLRWIEVPSQTWLQYVMNTPGIYGWMVCEEDTPLAQLQLDTDTNQTGYIGLIVNPEWQNQGWGKRILRDFLARPEANALCRIIATIELENIASLRCFSAVGFKPETLEPDKEGFLHLIYKVPGIKQ